MSARAFTIFLAGLGLIGLLFYGILAKATGSLEIGDPVPDTPLPKLGADGSGTIADYEGKWVLVNFWASWCDPCRDEAPALESFHREHSKGGDFVVLGIDQLDVPEDGLEFVGEFGLTYPQLRDPDGERQEDFGMTGLPENFLVDPDGTIALVRRGPVNREYLDEFVAPLIEGRKAPPTPIPVTPEDLE